MKEKRTNKGVKFSGKYGKMTEAEIRSIIKDSSNFKILSINLVDKTLGCICVCGKKYIETISVVARGRRSSCGCKKGRHKYIGNIERINQSYYNMMDRCYNEKLEVYKYYGGRGVVVCEEWKNNYQSFLDWSKSNGWFPGAELDKDIKGSGLLYSPGTCCWVTHKENCGNQRRCKKYLHDGKYVNLIDKAILIGLDPKTIYHRRKVGVSDEKLFDPVKKIAAVKIFKDSGFIEKLNSFTELVEKYGGEKRSWYDLARGKQKSYLGYTIKKIYE